MPASSTSTSCRRARCQALPPSCRCSTRTRRCATSARQIAAVAAVDRKTAQAALAAIKVHQRKRCRRRSASRRRARTDAPVVFPGRKKNPDNVSEGTGGPAPWKKNMRGPVCRVFEEGPRRRASGSPTRAKARDPLLVDGTFRTGTQQHTCLEPHAAVARFDGDDLTVHVSTQAVFHLKELIAKRFKLDEHKVRVIADHVGGGFGSKAALGMETVAAIELARAAQAPVRVAFDRHEELSVAGYRPARGDQGRRCCRRRDGSLKALSMDAYADTGAAINSTIAGLAPADLSGGGEASRRLRRRQQPAAGRAIPWPGRAADGVRAGAGGRRSRPAAEDSIRSCCASAGIPIRTGSGFTTGRLGLDVWRNRPAPASQNGRYRRGVGVAAGYWLYLWQPGSSVELAIEERPARRKHRDAGYRHRHAAPSSPTPSRAHSVSIRRTSRCGSAIRRLPEGPGSGGSRTTASVVPPTLMAVAEAEGSDPATAPSAADSRARTRRGAT